MISIIFSSYDLALKLSYQKPDKEKSPEKRPKTIKQKNPLCFGGTELEVNQSYYLACKIQYLY